MRKITCCFLSLLAVITPIFGLPYSMRRINKTGIYFEPVGKVKYYHNSWEIVSYIKLMQPDELERQLNASEAAVTTVCQGYHDKLELHLADTCLNTKQQVQTLNQRIRDLFSHIDPAVTRSKRGLVNAGGKLAKFLFGTMDEEDAKSIFERLQVLERNNQKQMELMQEQTSVIKSNFEASRKPIDDVKKDLKEISDFIKERQKVNNKNFQEISENEKAVWTRIAFHEFASSVLLQCHELERQLSITANIMSSINNGRLHPLVLSFQQVTEYIKNVTSFSEVDRGINAFTLEQLARTQGAIYGDTLLMKITVPIPEQATYRLERIHYLPVFLSKQVTALLTSHDEYLALDEGETKFITMRRGDLVSYCQDVLLNITAKIKVCKLTTPIITSEKGNCLLLLRRGWPEAKDFCSLTYTNFSADVLTKLQNPNTWIYTFQTEREMHVDCPKFHTTIRLTDNGILSLQPECQATVEKYQLRAENRITAELPPEQPDKFMPWHLPVELNNTNLQSPSTPEIKLHITDSHSHDALLQTQHGKILKLEDHLAKEQHEEQVSKIQSQTLMATVLSSCGGVIILIFLASKLWRHIPGKTRSRGNHSHSSQKPYSPKERREGMDDIPHREIGTASSDILPPPPPNMLGQLPIRV